MLKSKILNQVQDLVQHDIFHLFTNYEQSPGERETVRTTRSQIPSPLMPACPNGTVGRGEGLGGGEKAISQPGHSSDPQSPELPSVGPIAELSFRFFHVPLDG